MIWYAGDNAEVRRQLRASDVVSLERGFIDDGITSGDGRWSWRTFVGLIDRVHADGDRVLLDSDTDTQAERLYGLAAYLLVTDGGDFYGDGASSNPDNWWSGYDVELGDALGKRYLSHGVWRRDFERGSVFVNEPDEPQRTVELEAADDLNDLSGDRQVSISLGPAAGAVLLRDGLDPTPAAGDPPAAAPVAPRAPMPIAVAPGPAPIAATPELVPTAAGTRPASVVRLSARVRSGRGLLHVSGVVRGATSGRVLVSARSASGRRGARAAVRVGRSGRFARRLRIRAGRWRVRAEYRGVSAVRSVRVR